MINDNVTEMMDLGSAPKRRGRPSTGKAMSAAEKQKLYRQRLKDRNVTVNEADTIADLRSQIELLKRQLATVLESGNVTKKYKVERLKPAGRWVSIGEWASTNDAERHVTQCRESDYRTGEPDNKYRIIPITLL